jgi:hypothetical protein
MSESISQATAPEVAATGLPGGAAGAAAPRAQRLHLLRLRNKKLLFGLGLELLVLVAIIVRLLRTRRSRRTLKKTDVILGVSPATTCTRSHQRLRGPTCGRTGAGAALMAWRSASSRAGVAAPRRGADGQNIIVMIPSLVLLVVIGSYLSSASVFEVCHRL